MSLAPRLAPHLYAVVSRTAQAPAHRRRIEVLKTEKLAELTVKTNIDRANALLDRIGARQTELQRRMEALQRQQRVCVLRAERIGERIIAELEAAALTRAEGFRTALLISPSPAAVDIVDLALIPAEYMRQPKLPAAAPDKPKIKSTLEAGQRVAGCRLTQGVTLRRS